MLRSFAGMLAEEYDACSAYGLSLFNFGQHVAAQHGSSTSMVMNLGFDKDHSSGLLLADTKYEFGKDATGRTHFFFIVHRYSSAYL